MIMTVCSRRSARPSVLGFGCLLATVTLLGCASVLEGPGNGGDGGGGGGPGSAPYDHPTGTEDVLVSVEVEGGFVPVEYNLRNTAQFLLLGDGTVIVPGVMIEIFPGPAINPLQATTVSEEQIQELYTAADEGGLLDGEIDYGQPGVTDVPTTTVTLTVDGRKVSQSAYALNYQDAPDPGLTAEQNVAREALQAFIDTAQGLAGSASEGYVPTGVVAYRIPPREQTTIDPDLAQKPVVWPIVTAPPPIPAGEFSSCVAITGPEAVDLLAVLDGANELTPWLIGTESPANLVFRPLLSGDPGCE